MPEVNKSNNPHLQVRPVLIGWAVIVVIFTAILFFTIGYNFGQDNPPTVETVTSDSEAVEMPPVPGDPSDTATTDDTTPEAEVTLSAVAE